MSIHSSISSVASTSAQYSISESVLAFICIGTRRSSTSREKTKTMWSTKRAEGRDREKIYARKPPWKKKLGNIWGLFWRSGRFEWVVSSKSVEKAERSQEQMPPRALPRLCGKRAAESIHERTVSDSSALLLLLPLLLLRFWRGGRNETPPLAWESPHSHRIRLSSPVPSVNEPQRISKFSAVITPWPSADSWETNAAAELGTGVDISRTTFGPASGIGHTKWQHMSQEGATTTTHRSSPLTTEPIYGICVGVSKNGSRGVSGLGVDGLSDHPSVFFSSWSGRGPGSTVRGLILETREIT